jgi:hypothetical protein
MEFIEGPRITDGAAEHLSAPQRWAGRFHLGSGPFWLIFTYVTPVLINDRNWGWKRPGRVALMEVLISSYAQLMFVEGVFQADPHPGNFLLTRSDRPEDQQSGTGGWCAMQWPSRRRSRNV